VYFDILKLHNNEKKLLKQVLIIAIVSVTMIGVMIPSVFAEFKIQGENIPSDSSYGCESQKIITSNRNYALEISLVAHTLNDDVSVVIQVDDQIIKKQKLSTNDERLPLIFKHELSNFNPDPMAGKKMHPILLQICLSTSSNDNKERSLTVSKLSWNYVSAPIDEPISESTTEIPLNSISTADKAEAAEAKAEAAEQRAAEQRAAEQRAAEQRAAEQRAAEQRAAEQRAAEQRAAEQRAAEQRAAEQRAAEQRAAEQRAAEQRAAEARAQAAIRAAEAKAAQDLTNLLIIGGIAIIIISVAIVLAKRKNKKSTSNVSQSSKPSGTYRPPPPATSTNTESSTMFFYECPKCHSGDIQNNPDGSVNCPSCGYRG